jgi:MFS family permease
VVAGIAVLSAIFASLFVRESPEELGQIVDGTPGPLPREQDPHAKALVTRFLWTPGLAYRTASYWMIVIGGMACQFPFFFFTAHWLLHLKGAGVQAADAAWAMGVFTLGAVVGRLIGGWLMDRMAARYAFMLGLCCYFLGSVLAIRVNPHALWIAYLAAILYGTGFGWTFICVNTATGHFFGPSAFPKLNGLMLLLTAVFCSPAGYIGGKLFDLYGNYTLAFEINILISAAGVVALFFARMPTPPAMDISVRQAELAQAD